MYPNEGKTISYSNLCKHTVFDKSQRYFYRNFNGMKKSRIVFMGTPAFATYILKALHEHGHDIAAVVTVPDKPAGRGQKMHVSDVKQYAVAHNLPLLQPDKLKNTDFVDALKNLKADVFVVVAFRMLPREVWSIPPHGTFNLHASLLPQYRGAAPINHAVINGETLSGVTTFLIDEAIDTGNIILRREEPITDTDTAGTLHDRLMVLGAGAVLETVDMLMAGNPNPVSQDRLLQPGETPKPAPKIYRADCKIDPNNDAVSIYNKARGLSPYPGAYLVMDFGGGDVQEIKVFETAVKEGPSGDYGKVHTDGKTFLSIETKNKQLEIKSLQSPGKKRLEIAEWLRGMKSTDAHWRVL